MSSHYTISRRRFLGGSVSAGAGLFVPSLLPATEVSTDANRFALIADTHIHANRAHIEFDSNMADNFGQCLGEILAIRPRPAAAIVAGDCAAATGQPGDYVVLKELLEPARRAGLPVHLALGNHDNRKNLRAAFSDGQTDNQRPVPDRNTKIISSPHANWFLLDSLDRTGPGAWGGVLGKPQLDWLAKALDAHADKPAIVIVHHNLGKGPGLKDSDMLCKVILPRKQVKAYFHGHHHRWQLGKREEIHIINLPALGFTWAKNQPLGWVDVQLHSDGATLTMHSLDNKHPTHGQKTQLTWR